MKKYCLPLLLATALCGCQFERNSQVCEVELPIIDCTIDKDSPREVFDSIFEFKDYLLLETNEYSTLTCCSLWVVKLLTRLNLNFQSLGTVFYGLKIIPEVVRKDVFT